MRMFIFAASNMSKEGSRANLGSCLLNFFPNGVEFL